MIAALGLGLLASGVKGLKQYWRELIMCCFYAYRLIPQIIEELLKLLR